MSFGTACLLYAFAIAKDLKNGLILMNECAETKEKLHITEKLVEFLRFTNIRELSIFSLQRISNA